ncbi:MAG: glycosyltransferase family 4 protein [Actinobacteria bacterium]|nr:glycosyltransferase family 4 protein [Actinomycetota bacterium]MBU4482749.1 glycosyltransferase family 4 protein [Actinomycetota bacterium]MCG2790123.1 glycosyltransferase family 4 protein [Actinomycetes bacterium]
MKNKQRVNKRKILNIVPTPFFADRGCHMRILGEMKALANYGYQNIIVTYHNGRDLEGLDIRRIINIPWYRKLEAGPSIHKFYIDILLFFKAAAVYFKEKPDIIYGHLHEGAFVGGLVKYLLTFGKIPLVFDVQGSLTSELDTFNWIKGRKVIRWFFYTLEKFICRMPDFFICSSVSNGDIIKNRFHINPDKVRVVIDGVHTDFFSKPPKKGFKEELGIPGDAPLIIFTGALLAAKGIWNLVSAIPLVLEKRKDVHFLIVGYPVEETAAKVRELGVEKNAHLTGMVDYFKLPDYLVISDIAVEPKVDKAGEASGKVINYMGAGLPVVCFEGKNNRRFLGEGGIYAVDDKVENLAAQMIWAVENPDEAKRLGELNRKRVEEVFSWNNSIKATVEAFEKLISK